MPKDYDVYIDSEEDEVFFGFISEREKNVSAKLVKPAAEPEDLPEVYKSKNPDRLEDVNVKKDDVLPERNIEIVEKDAESPFSDVYVSLDESNLRQTLSSNTSVEIEHSYSTPVKQKIDKTIFATPNSVVKADRDGGFLKVLSEIALVKAELEADTKINESLKEDEDKENKIIPEINIIEATPEKINQTSPSITFNTQIKKCRIFYDSPKVEKNEDFVKSENQKVIGENFESSQNLKNKLLNCINETGHNKIESNSTDNDSSNFQCELISINDLQNPISSTYSNEVKEETKQNFEDEVSRNRFSKNFNSEKQVFDLSEVKNKETKDEVHDLSTQSIISIKDEYKVQDTSIKKIKENQQDLKEDDNHVNLNETFDIEIISESNTTHSLKKLTEKKDNSVIPEVLEKNQFCENSHLQKARKLLFAKEAKEIIKEIKKSTVDDTLNFTVQEIDVENVENSFMVTEISTLFNDSIIPEKKVEVPALELLSQRSNSWQSSKADLEITPAKKTCNSEKKHPPILSQTKINSLNIISEKKNSSQNPTIQMKWGKKEKIATEEKKKECTEKEKELNPASTSKIPVFSVKHPKTPVNEHGAQLLTTKSTSVNSASRKILKNPKFNNIESPISAYIHNKPTSLVLNVKSSTKKETNGNVWKGQATGSESKIPKKAKTTQIPKCVSRLPFVEYKSTAFYEVQKQPESRLPRLAPTLQKLIGTRSPKVLKHQGRFYVKTPGKPTSNEEATLVADTMEVSLLVSQAAQKGKVKKLL